MVEAALTLLAAQHTPPPCEAVRAELAPTGSVVVPAVTTPVLDFDVYDRLLAAGGAHA